MINRKHILIVEDNLALADAIAVTLRYEQIYEIYQTNTINGAQDIIMSKPIDLIVLDRMLNNVDSIDFLQWLQVEKIDVKIIFLSVKSTTRDRIIGLKAGAHDYLGKPFDIEELCLRVDNLLNDHKATSKSRDNFQFGNNRINLKTKQAHNCRNELLLLSNKENKLLQHFIANPNTLLTRAVLFEHVWGYPYNEKTRVIDNLIMKFRKFFEPKPQEPIHFLSKRNGGYMFCP